LAVVAVGLETVTAIPAGILLSAVSTKVITEDELKFVHPFPVMVTLTVVPTVPAPGDTTATAAGGFCVVADPRSDTISADPPGAVFPTVSEPLSGPFAVRLGTKFVEMMHEDWASTTPVGQLLKAMKSPTGFSVNVSGWVS
jgi:hypothetical protein